MSSDKDIANQALLMIGSESIVSFDDGTVEANACKVLYEPCKKQLLRSYDWNCANATDRLAQLATPPVDTRWSYTFAIPDNALRILEVIEVGDVNNKGSGEPVKFEVARRTILTNCQHVAARYIDNIAEPYLDSHVEMALVARLALDLSYTLTASNTRESNLATLAERKLEEARTTDSLERTHKFLRIDTLQNARG